MTLRFTKILFPVLICLLFLLFESCGNKRKEKGFTQHKLGYKYQLISFSNDSTAYKSGLIARVTACFKTQNDSVFYDTKNDLKGRFFVTVDSNKTDNFLKHRISLSMPGDSVCLLIKPDLFFEQQFASKVPNFCTGDSAVKVFFKVDQVYTEPEFEHLKNDITSNETQEIETFFGSVKDFELARDPSGFFWVEKPSPANNLPEIKQGNLISLKYEGGFLNGRIVDVSPENFQLTYGTPDQVLKGINYVIGRLKMGQTSKIILPSHLAFGQNGSSNGSIPPFTPMLYKITITNVETN